MTKQRLGIVGGGQLALMMAQEAQENDLNLEIIASDPNLNCPSASYLENLIQGDFKDKATLEKIAQNCDYMTYEIELANAEVLETIERNNQFIYPSPNVLKIIQDKLSQSRFFDQHELPIPKYFMVNDQQDLKNAIKELGLPLMIKSRFDSYDGKGNFKLTSENQIEEVFERFDKAKLLAQEYINFDHEVSVICVGAKNGESIIYPVFLNKHGEDYHILHRTLMPAPLQQSILEQAQKVANDVLKVLNGIGVFTVEFLVHDSKVLINEVAPRVHNSGHLTIEACDYSQFHLHLLAGLKPSIPSPKLLTKHALMQNIIGPSDFTGEYEVIYDGHSLKDLQSFDNRLFFHLYGKAETKPYRKLGHWTLLSKNKESIAELEHEADTILQEIRVIPKSSAHK